MRSLDGTIFSWVYDAARSENDEDLFDKISIVWIVVLLGVVVLKYVRPIHYGKTAALTPKRSGFLSYNISSKFLWRYGLIAMIIVPLLMIIATPCSKIGHFCNAVGLAMHCWHYFNRTIIYPSKISPKATPQILWFFLLAVFLSPLYGFIQSHHLLNVHAASADYVTYFGILVFIVGAFINTYHDNLLISLRETSKKSNRSDSSSNYTIPRGALFEYVSCANFFSELMEWWGCFMVTKGLPQFLFAITSSIFLGNRSRFVHKFYKDTFGKAYPKNRKAIVPFIY